MTLLTGCGKQEQIRSYSVPKETSPAPIATASKPAQEESSGEPTDRMLAAILPAGDRAWFLKVTGPIANVDKQDKAIDEFFKSVAAKPGDAKPIWTLPDGWSEKPGTGMRAATIMVPAEGGPLELSVIGLPWSGAEGELLSNINRWRGQMKLPEVNQDALIDFTREVGSGDATMTIVDLRGNFSAGSMAAPFAGGGPFSGERSPSASPPASDSARSSDGNLPAGHPPMDDADQAADAVPITYSPPEGWQSLPAGGMRKAAFGIVEGDQRALITVIDFPAKAGPMIADPLQNINRWRREVGLAEIDKGALDESIESVDIGGQKATYVEMIPDATKPAESQAPLATAAAMVTEGDQIWFFKLTGSRDLVTRELEKFKSFLKSVKFTSP